MRAGGGLWTGVTCGGMSAFGRHRSRRTADPGRSRQEIPRARALGRLWGDPFTPRPIDGPRGFPEPVRLRHDPIFEAKRKAGGRSAPGDIPGYCRTAAADPRRLSQSNGCARFRTRQRPLLFARLRNEQNQVMRLRHIADPIRRKARAQRQR